MTFNRETRPAQDRARISHGLKRYHERRRASLRVVPTDLLALRRGDVKASLAPFVAEAHLEAAALIQALGGDTVSPQRRVVVSDLVRVGVALRGELRRYMRTEDPDCASRVGTLAGVRRASLVALGLDERRVEHDLKGYLEAQRAAQAAPGEEIDTTAAPIAKPRLEEPLE